MFSARERAHGIHGGDAETSLMLAFRPDTVKMSEARDFESLAETVERESAQLRVTQPIGFGWMSSDLHPLGAVGNAANATAERGETLADSGAEKFIDLLRDVLAFDLAALAPRSAGEVVKRASVRTGPDFSLRARCAWRLATDSSPASTRSDAGRWPAPSRSPPSSSIPTHPRRPRRFQGA